MALLLGGALSNARGDEVNGTGESPESSRMQKCRPAGARKLACIQEQNSVTDVLGCRFIQVHQYLITGRASLELELMWGGGRIDKGRVNLPKND